MKKKYIKHEDMKKENQTLMLRTESATAAENANAKSPAYRPQG
jgi:hypothetical protein